MKKIFAIIRSGEWWEYKLSPLLAIGYATSLSTTTPLFQVAPHLLLILVATAVGAMYVSVINDITDMEEDLAAGKNNRMAKIPVNKRWIIPACCAIIGILFLIFFFKDNLSRILYLLPWISFSLYSFAPVRLKKRGLWGTLADACGSHVFISLLIIASVDSFTGSPLDWTWFFAFGIWSLFYGLRGILCHQFTDRKHDLQINLGTFATRTDPKSFSTISMILFSIELFAFTFILFRISLFIVYFFLMLYFALVLIRHKKWGQRTVLVVAPDNLPYQILMVDYYQSFFPISILLYASLTQPNAWIVLLAHVILFNATIRKAAWDFLMMIKPKMA
ncbi:MAG: hypothetical protein C5B59_10695 [Bacteroidetes bacterium]|nr:MAG: hypothetical protein C5B59_10695 [Bacteroidota bacterium]